MNRTFRNNNANLYGQNQHTNYTLPKNNFFGKMKLFQFITATAIFISASACNNNTASENDKKEDKTSASAEVEKPANTSTKEIKPIKITKQDFLAKVMNYEVNTTEWKFEGDKPCLIDFYADWCGPCKITSPILDDLAKEYGGKINIYKIDTDKEKELAMAFGIQSIPSFLFCPMNGQPTMSAGIARTPAETKQMFIKMIDELLLGNVQ